MSGEPGDEPVLIDLGLVPPGVDRAKEGIKASLGSGVFGALGGVMRMAACERLVELIHISSRELKRGDSGRMRNASAKWSRMNLSTGTLSDKTSGESTKYLP